MCFAALARSCLRMAYAGAECPLAASQAPRVLLAALALEPCSEPGSGFGRFAAGCGVKGGRVQGRDYLRCAGFHPEAFEARARVS